MLMYRRRWALFYLPVLIAAASINLLAVRDWFPLPPTEIVIAAGVQQGGYEQLAERYRDELARHGITAQISTAPAGAPGAAAPLQRLANPADPAQMGFAHGLLSDRGPEAPVQALAIIGKQPVWIFSNHSGVSSLAQLRGLRLAAGPRGSATREITQALLAHAQLKETDVSWNDQLQGMAAANALIEGKVDAVVMIGSSLSPSVRLLSRSPGITMAGVDRANALAAREPRLKAMVLPQGAIELRGDVPPRDLTLLYTNTHLLVRNNLHPALQRALLDAAGQVHGVAGPLQRLDEYPDTAGTDFPLSPQAQRYAAGYRPWLEQALPYWWAQLAALLLYGVLPILLTTAVALWWIPRFFSVRVNAVLSHYYGELKFLENDMERVAADNPQAIKGLLSKLDQMDQQVAALDLPDRFADRWYTLRSHLAAAQDRLLKMRAR